MFLTRKGCRQACTGSTLGPVTLPTIDMGGNAKPAPLPAGTEYTISPGTY